MTTEEKLAAAEARVKELEEADGLLEWLATRPDLSLEYYDPEDDRGPAWIVHQYDPRTVDKDEGNWGDVGKASTPRESLTQARALLKGGDA